MAAARSDTVSPTSPPVETGCKTNPGAGAAGEMTARLLKWKSCPLLFGAYTLEWKNVTWVIGPDARVPVMLTPRVILMNL